MAHIDGAAVLVTGANGGIGSRFVEALADRGAATIHAGVRRPDTADALRARFGARLSVVPLDLTDATSIDAAVAAVGEIDLLVSNAGQTLQGPVLDIDDAATRENFEINLFGPHRLSLGLLPGLRVRRGGIINVLSMCSWLPVPGAEGYCASKAAAMMLAHGIRTATLDDGVSVSLAYPGFVDTPMSDNFTAPKADPRRVADRILDGWLAGEASIFPDQFAAMTRDVLLNDMPRVLDEPAALLGDLVGAFFVHPQAGQ